MEESIRSPIVRTGSYPGVADEPVSTAAPTSASSPIAASTGRGRSEVLEPEPDAVLLSTSRRRVIRVDVPRDARDQVDVEVVRRAGTRPRASSGVAPMPRRGRRRARRGAASASRASATCSGVAQLPVQVREPESIVSKPMPVIVASRSSNRPGEGLERLERGVRRGVERAPLVGCAVAELRRDVVRAHEREQNGASRSTFVTPSRTRGSPRGGRARGTRPCRRRRSRSITRSAAWSTSAAHGKTTFGTSPTCS